MKKRKCTKCKEIKPLSDFYFKNKSKGTRRFMCKTCVKDYNRKHYRNNKDAYKRTAIKNKSKYSKINKKKLWNYLKDKECIDCGENNNIVLEFDHIKNNKNFDIGSAITTGYTWKTILQEIEKCEIVCCNCHKIRTTKRGNHWRVNFDNNA